MYQPETKYQIQVEEYLNFYQERILHYLYQPLIGKNAYSLYNFLFQEEQFARNVNFNLKIERLLNFLFLDNKKLDNAIITLNQFNLLKTIYDPITLTTLFVVKKPLSLSRFYKSTYFNNFRNKFNAKTIEEIYFWLRPNDFNWKTINKNKENENIKKTIFQNQSIEFKEDEIYLSLKEIIAKNKLNYKIKNKDLDFIKKIHKDLEISFEVIKVLIEFMFFRIQKFSIIYLDKVLETLQEKKIYQNLNEVKLFLQSLFQNMPVEEKEKKPHYFPEWLKVNKTEMKFNFNQKEFNNCF